MVSSTSPLDISAMSVLWLAVIAGGLATLILAQLSRLARQEVAS